jgi:hypothetical protein
MRYERVHKDGRREVVYWSGSGEPVWVEGEPAWHFWLLALTWFVVLPVGVVVYVAGCLAGWW